MKSRILVCVCGADGKKPRYNRVFTGTIKYDHQQDDTITVPFLKNVNYSADFAKPFLYSIGPYTPYNTGVIPDFCPSF